MGRGFATLKVSGSQAFQIFKDESGGHRWQRVPPTEKRGRVQTSTITVAVLSIPTPQQIQIREQDVEIIACRGSGAGGQHRNKTSTAIQAKHLPTGLSVRVEAERSQFQNKELALEVLRCRIQEAATNRASSNLNNQRRQQIGSGMRGDKRRTIAVQRGTVDDHETGRSWRFSDYEKGNW